MMRILILFLGTIFLALPVAAYIGPGPLLPLLSSAMGIVIAIAFSLLVVITYPLRLLYLKLRKKKK